MSVWPVAAMGTVATGTTKNTVIECTLLEVIHLEPPLDHISTVVQDLNRY
jgi:hypothetical protein